MTEDQIASIQYAADWLSRSEDIGNRKHGERLRALLSASIADTAGAKADEQEMTALNVAIMVLKKEGILQNAYALENLRNRISALPASSVADAHTCAQAVLDLRGMLLRLIKYEGMANDDATNKLYQKTTDALFAASRIKEGAPSVADAAGASEDDALEKIDREKALRVSGHFDIGINNRMAYRDGWNDCVAAIKKESGND